MNVYPEDSLEFAIQTAVMSSLPHATHPMHGDWRSKADALIASLDLVGFKIVPRADAGRRVSIAEPERTTP